MSGGGATDHSKLGLGFLLLCFPPWLVRVRPRFMFVESRDGRQKEAINVDCGGTAPEDAMSAIAKSCWSGHDEPIDLIWLPCYFCQ